jgi:hypothetical protein
MSGSRDGRSAILLNHEIWRVDDINDSQLRTLEHDDLVPLGDVEFYPHPTL